MKVSYLIFLTLQFPWIMSAYNSFDTQPWVPLLSLSGAAYIGYTSRSKIKYSWIFYFLTIFVLYLLSNHDLNMEVLRVLLTSLTLIATFYYCACFVEIFGKEQMLKLLAYGNTIYLFFAFLQFGGIDVVGLFVEVRTSNTRGVTSLAPEPGFFGLVLGLYSFVFYLSERYHKLVLINLVVLVILVKSFTALLFFAIVGSMVLFSRLRPSKILGIISSVATLSLLTYFSFRFLDLGRLESLVNRLLENPYSLLLVDKSAANRFIHVVSPFIIHFENFAMPVREETINILRAEFMLKYYPAYYFESVVNKTSSFVGAYIQSFGILIYPLLIHLAFRAFKSRNFIAFLGLLIAFNTSVPIGLPLVAVVFFIITQTIQPRKSQ